MSLSDELTDHEGAARLARDRTTADQARRGDPPPPARGGRGGLRRAGVSRGIHREDHRASGHRPRHLLPVLRQQAVDLRGARDRPQPPRAALDVRGDGGRVHRASRPSGRDSPASSASRPSTRRSTASCARRSSSHPRCCVCTTRASSRDTRRDSRAAQRPATSIPGLDPATTAWALMGMGELIGMRFLLWERDEAGRPPAELDPAVFDAMMRFIDNALAPRAGRRKDPPHRDDLAGKRALVTGGASGIGLACAHEFARRGAHVDHRRPERGCRCRRRGGGRR